MCFERLIHQVGKQRHGPFHQSPAHADSKKAANGGKGETFDEELGEDRAAARSQCATHREFLRARCAAGQQQIGDVGTGDKQGQPDGGQQEPEVARQLGTLRARIETIPKSILNDRSI